MIKSMEHQVDRNKEDEYNGSFYNCSGVVLR